MPPEAPPVPRDAHLGDAETLLRWFRFAPDEMAKFHPLSTLLGLGRVEAEAGQGFARLHFDVGPSFTNYMGKVHGGVLATLLDEAAGLASLALVGRGFRGTGSAKITFLKSADPGQLIAEATVIKRTSSLLMVEASVAAADGTPRAKGLLTCAYGDLPS